MCWEEETLQHTEHVWYATSPTVILVDKDAAQVEVAGVSLDWVTRDCNKLLLD